MSLLPAAAVQLSFLLVSEETGAFGELAAALGSAGCGLQDARTPGEAEAVMERDGATHVLVDSAWPFLDPAWVMRVQGGGSPAHPRELVVLVRDEDAAGLPEALIEAGVADFWPADISPACVRARLALARQRRTRELARRAAEVHLRESEARYRQIFEHNQAVKILVDPATGAIVDANSSACAFYGYPREVLCRMNIGEINTSPRDRIEDAMSSAAGAPSAHYHFRHRLASGELREVEVYTGPVEVGGRRLLCSIIHDLTDLKVAERALAESEARYRHMVETMEEGLWVIDDQGRTTYTNRKMASLLGYTPEEILGKSLFDFMDPAEIPVVTQRMADRKAGRPEQHDFRFLRRDGSYLWSIVTASPFFALDGRFLGSLGIVTDLTQRKAMEDALRESEERFRQLFTLLPEPVAVQDRAGHITDVNPAFEALMGEPRASILGKTPYDYLTPEFHEAARLRNERVGSAEAEVEIVRPDGRRLWLEVHASTATMAGEQVRLSVFRDVTARKRTEAAMLQAQKLESLGVLAGGIAHDFNNILASVLGHTELALQHTAEDAPAQRYLDRIRMGASRAADLCRQLLAYSGRGCFVVEEADLGTLVRETVDLLALSLPKGVRLEMALGTELPRVAVDATQVRQALMNLVINAADAIGDGDGSVRVSTGLASFGPGHPGPGGRTGNFEYLEVADTGCGMDEQVKARIFDPFFTTKFTGRGLGLAAVLGIMRGHEGEIQVESTPGRGTTFRLLFPVAGTGGELPPPAPERAPEPFRGEGLVLVVDDEAVGRELFAEVLECWGFETLQAEDGLQGMELYKAHRGRIRLVLADLTMPGLNGRELFRGIRALDKEVPVVLMSGYSETEAGVGLAQEGLTGFLPKPFSLADLEAKLRDALKI